MASLTLPVAVIGAGPVGLAAAAHLLERGETPLLLEAGDSIGANVRQWQHVRMFSPWQYTVDAASVRLLQAHGWTMPPLDDLPTGRDLIERYMQPLADVPAMQAALHLNARVTAISRRHIDKMKDAAREDAPFVLHVVFGDGREMQMEARAVIDATGTWQQPNPLGASGLPALGEKRHAAHIAYGIPDVLGEDSARYANKRVLVVGSGHSALNSLLALADLHASHPNTTITWAMRGSNMTRVYGGGEADALPARAQLGGRLKTHVEAGIVRIVSPFRIHSVESDEHGMIVTGETQTGPQRLTVDEIIAATGARPHLDMLRELRLDLDAALESTRTLGPLIDPNIHSCGTVRPHGEAELRQPEAHFYIVGMKSYGRAPTFLLATGYEQVRSVVAALVGDWEAARDVQLNLPETGVCSSDLGDAGGACCAPASVTPSAQPALISLSSIATHGGLLQIAMPQTQAAVQDCGCDTTCCADGTRSTTCGCDSACC